MVSAALTPLLPSLCRIELSWARMFECCGHNLRGDVRDSGPAALTGHLAVRTIRFSMGEKAGCR